MLTLRKIMGGHRTAEILCLYKKRVVRELIAGDDSVDIHFMEGTVVGLPLDTLLHYEPWDMDRGSILIPGTEHGDIKLCTEFDIIRFDDGSEQRVQP
jgi:hypothetical protein